ncbi:hypothetical protein BYT27DRAFT_7217467 [Phlegmacium glaucopus]|nr:hypothetical protein BYT27DRAFT_7217467 [Phlegmacium glaucopus]
MSAIHQFIINQKARALSEGIKIVRDILKSNAFPNGFTSSQLFQAAVQRPPPPDFPAYHHTGLTPVVKPNKNRFAKVKPVIPWAPSHPEHPIRSIRFLKLEVLPALEKSSEIKMIRQPRLTPVDPTIKVKKGRDPGVEFVWKVIDPNDVPPPPRPKPVKEVVGKEVGVGMDFQHLNKRRQNARVGKITRDVDAMKNIRRLQEEQIKRGTTKESRMS